MNDHVPHVGVDAYGNVVFGRSGLSGNIERFIIEGILELCGDFVAFVGRIKKAWQTSRDRTVLHGNGLHAPRLKELATRNSHQSGRKHGSERRRIVGVEQIATQEEFHLVRHGILRDIGGRRIVEDIARLSGEGQIAELRHAAVTLGDCAEITWLALDGLSLLIRRLDPVLVDRSGGELLELDQMLCRLRGVALIQVEKPCETSVDHMAMRQLISGPNDIGGRHRHALNGWPLDDLQWCDVTGKGLVETIVCLIRLDDKIIDICHNGQCMLSIVTLEIERRKRHIGRFVRPQGHGDNRGIHQVPARVETRMMIGCGGAGTDVLDLGVDLVAVQ